MKPFSILIFYFLHPKFLPLFTKKLIQSFKTRIRIKVTGLYSVKWYPDDIQKACKAITIELTSQHHSPTCFHLKNLSNQWDEQINLAGTRINIGNIDEAWSGKLSQDPEVLFSSHRFHWIIEATQTGLKPEHQDQLFCLVKRWSNANHRQEANEPYSVSERICNLSLYFWLGENTLFQDLSKRAFILSLIRTQTLELLTKLEYPASGIINNHILNNARAIYTSGVLLKNKQLRDLSYMIFDSEEKKIIDENGFLKECSSHYQLLLSKNIRELSMLESELDERTYFASLSKKVNDATGMLIDNSTLQSPAISNIGDISPDIPTNWYWLTQECPWANIWKSKLNLQETPMSSGWSRLHSSSWFALSQIHDLKGPYPKGHGHDDYGSFTLSYKGTPIIIDRGRKSYHNQLGNRRSDHNTICEGPKLKLTKGAGIKEAMSMHSKRLLNSKATSDQINFEIKGYWSRQIKVDSDNFFIHDFYISASDAFLYFSPSLEVTEQSKNIFLITDKNLSLKLTLDGSGITPRLQPIETFPSYGQSESSQYLTWKGVGQVRVRISVND